MPNAVSEWKTYDIAFPGFFRDYPDYSKTITAKSAGAAKYEAYLEFSDAYDIPFKEFLKIIKCTSLNRSREMDWQPAPDQRRIDTVNRIIQEIAQRGRRFLYSKQHNRVSRFYWSGAHLWFVDHYSDVPLRMIPKRTDKDRNAQKYFTSGGTLWGLVHDFKDFIFGDNEANHNNGYGGLYCPHWGYPEEDMEAIRAVAVELGYLKPGGAMANV